MQSGSVMKDAAWARAAWEFSSTSATHERLGRDVIGEKYGNLFEMYEKITDGDP